MSNWRDYVLQHFREPIHRLTLVADPDGLMLEEELLAAIRQNGFDLLPFEDPIAFRYAYESGYRQHWDQGQDTDLTCTARRRKWVVILRSPGASLHSLPYDLLQSGRTFTFSLPDLFPRLSYPVIRDLDLVYLQPLYEACQRYTGPEMGDRASTLFVLKHVFGLVSDMKNAGRLAQTAAVAPRPWGTDATPPRRAAVRVAPSPPTLRWLATGNAAAQRDRFLCLPAKAMDQLPGIPTTSRNPNS
jgi:hypothetical protein